MSYYYRRGQKIERKATVRYLLIALNGDGYLIVVDPRRSFRFVISHVKLKQSVDNYLKFDRKNIDYVVRMKPMENANG